MTEPRPLLLRESADPEGQRVEILRATRIFTPTRVHSHEHRWYRPVRYD